MSPQMRALLVWAPRVLGLSLSLFLSLFAFDGFDGRRLAETLPAAIINLAPAALVATVVAAAWRHPWIGAAGFAALAIGYAALVPHRPDWILVISGPLMVTALLYVAPSFRSASHGRT